MHGSTKEVCGSEDSEVICILVRRRDAVLRSSRCCAEDREIMYMVA